MNKQDKIVITGAAGLVGQNLILLLREQGYERIVAIDKNNHNLQIVKQFNPDVQIIKADLSKPGDWRQAFAGAERVIILHAQITSKSPQEFIANNIIATQQVLATIKQYNVPYCVHISSSVVNSVAKDDYTNTKKVQEKIVLDSGIACCILRPTLMFGWFDPKHLGWLARFMEKMPIFPVPGNGQYMRQPLYSRDFCRMIISAMEREIIGEVYDVVGQEEIYYIDMIKTIKQVKGLKTPVVRIPYKLFYMLLKIYSLFSKKPPFTADQLEALTAGDYFTGIDSERILGVRPTPLTQAFTETFTDGRYCKIELERSNL